MKNTFNDFLDTVDERYKGLVVEINDYLTVNNCKCDIKSAKFGYTVSYILSDTKRTMATFVFRKVGIKMRIYAEHIALYQGFLDTLPKKIKEEIIKSSVCKRLINPDECNPKCVMGYSFMMDGEAFQKCRYMAFMPTLNEENFPFIKGFLEREINSRRG
jgi:hypothetical protein